MTELNAEVIRQSLDEAAAARLGELEIFSDIESTNSYLMQQPGPVLGETRIAATDNQTAGRGRHGRTWQSPPGSGLCLSMAYTFSVTPANLPALTLAIGLGVIDNLQALGINGVQLKWPNDLIAMNGKLGGILTEVHGRSSAAVTVVTGVGLNIDLGDGEDFDLDSSWAQRVVDLKSHVVELPGRERIAASMINGLSKSFVDYEANGFTLFANRWREIDWLFGRELVIDSTQKEISGVGAGIDDDGALLVETASEGLRRVTSGSVIAAGAGDSSS
jgi:BirA family biotin operon repressor/biotin-[acetyl-CoA-carboxylase] ligase